MKHLDKWLFQSKEQRAKWNPFIEMFRDAITNCPKVKNVIDFDSVDIETKTQKEQPTAYDYLLHDLSQNLHDSRNQETYIPLHEIAKIIFKELGEGDTQLLISQLSKLLNKKYKE